MKVMLILSFCLSNCCTLHSQTDTAFYFPMKLGDLWQYKEPPPPDEPYITEARTGRDTTFPNNQTYRSIIDKNYGYTDTIGIGFYRQVGNKVYQYIQGTQAEVLRYDFSKDKGDTVSIFPAPLGDTVMITIFDKGWVSIFGRSREYVTFYWKFYHSTNYLIEQIADSLGAIFSEVEPGYQLYLTGAVVDSVQYGVVTSVEAGKEAIPKEFMLFQNFPNPFNPSTTIYFRVPKGESFTLIIYNVLGQRVRMLYAGRGNGNTQSIMWDSKNDAGIRVSSSMYLYQIRSGDFLATKKMLLIQ
jgi:hypothetical protein